ncbi:GDSL-type esterase/lipase family protein [Periweissella fabalis]|uniref:SGNH hydrolase-type esterase domain-containing protein n=1 Tax=Periweissella fabalis TaxID=1070421 RepID=A0A7X6N113_9LACO|nr:GDSL-type esterase/lipase family protein [Periweissella fabalis]MCM0598994.1 hypothetical protein [Periweissella fabalis]NKZ23274.1 hypothetical protein [Periweissella fabalis]
MKNKKWFAIIFGIIILLGGGYWVSQQMHKPIHNTVVKPKTVKNLKIVALGDSLTQGVGDTTEQMGYPTRIAKVIQQQTKIPTTAINLGKEGDRSDQILARLKDSTMQQQAVKQANVIVLTVGGNDLLKILQGTIVDHSATQVNKLVAASVANYQKNLMQLLTTVRSYNEHASIFLFGNYNPLYVYFPNFTAINTSVETYNQVNATIVNKYHGHYVSIFNQLTYGQYQNKHARQALVAQANQTGANFLAALSNTRDQANEKNAFLSPADHFHPNAKGYDAMTKILAKQMLLHDKWQYQE